MSWQKCYRPCIWDFPWGKESVGSYWGKGSREGGEVDWMEN